MAATLGMVAFAYFAAEAILPVVLAVSLFFLLEPAVRYAEKKGVSRGALAPVLVIAVTLAVGAAMWGAYLGASDIFKQLPQYSEKIRATVSKIEGGAVQLRKSGEKFLPEKKASGSASQGPALSVDGWRAFALRGMSSALTLLTDLVLIPLITAFFLLESSKLRKRLKRAASPEFQVDNVGKDMGRMTRGYFIGNVVAGAGTALGFYAVFAAIGLEHAPLLAVFSGFVNLVPFAGTILGAILPCAQALLQFEGYSQILIIVGASLALHFVLNNVVMPKIVGSRINVNATAAMLGIVFWGWLWGAIGLLLAIPMMATLRILLQAHPATRGLAGLIADQDDDSSQPIARLTFDSTSCRAGGFRKKD